MNCLQLELRLETARNAARRAGELLGSTLWAEQTVRTKGRYDLALNSDSEAGELIEALIEKHFPGEAVLSEERIDVPEVKEGDFVWIIDPLDGTVNYHHKLPWFCVSIACFQLSTDQLLPPWGSPLVSTVYAPLLHQEFYASRDRGAWMENRHEVPRRLRVTDADLSQGILSYSRGSRPEDQEFIRSFQTRIGEKARKTRSHGAAALDLAFVAQGSLCAHVQRNLQAWDIAAGIQLIQEAGGQVHLTPFPGGYHVTAAAPSVLDVLLQEQGLA